MQTPPQELSPTIRALLARIDPAEARWRESVNDLQAAHWLVIAAMVREKVPEADGVRTTGQFNEDSLPRLRLVDVLRVGEPVTIDMRTFSRLEDDLAEPLLWIAELEPNFEHWLPETDHELPQASADPGLPTEQEPADPRYLIVVETAEPLIDMSVLHHAEELAEEMDRDGSMPGSVAVTGPDGAALAEWRFPVDDECAGQPSSASTWPTGGQPLSSRGLHRPAAGGART